MRFVLAIMALIAPVAVMAQIEVALPLPSEKYGLKREVPTVEMPPLDTAGLQREKPATGGMPYEFATVFEVNYTPQNSGQWMDIPGRGKIWTLGIRSKGAYSLNLTFGRFKLPEGARLFVYNQERTDIAGAFTSMNNKASRKLAVRPVPGDALVIEYFVPDGVPAQGTLALTRIGHDYKGAFARQGLEEKSQSCEININCDLGDEWQNEKHSVCKILINNQYICTGALVNNTNNDGRAFFLTANHCLNTEVSAQNTVFFFNYESETCLGSSGSYAQSISGANLRATAPNERLDFSLLELTTTPPSDYKPFYAGWDRSGQAPAQSVCIHHPDGDIKKISMDEDAAITGSFAQDYDVNSHWNILDWEYGATEGGSSGSPLFNENHKIIGDLTGGAATCENPVNDYFAKFDRSWDDFQDDDNQLKKWLDPTNQGWTEINGYSPTMQVEDIDAKLLSIVSPAQEMCNDRTFTPQVKVQNHGVEDLTSFTVRYKIGFDASGSYNWSGVLPSNQSVLVDLPLASVGYGTHLFEVEVVNPNNGTDENENNNKALRTIAILEGNALTLDIDLDDYGHETRWRVVNSQGGLLYSGGPYSSIDGLQEELCLPDGCYTFQVFDSDSDGVCCDYGEGAITLNNNSTGGQILSATDFGGFAEFGFCIEAERPDYDLAIVGTSVPEMPHCQHLPLQGGVIIKNLGSKEITDAVLSYNWDKGEATNIPWDGALQPGQRDTVPFPQIDFDAEGLYTLTFHAGPVTAMETDIINNDFVQEVDVVQGRRVRLDLLTDNYGSETTWQILEGEEVLYSGGPYKDNLSKLRSYNFCMPLGCYTFKILDSSGDGLCCGFGEGSYSLVNVFEDEAYHTGDEFQALEIKGFCSYPVSVPKRQAQAGFRVYPNPARGGLTVERPENGPAVAVLRDIAGRKVLQEAIAAQRAMLQINHLPQGMYFLQVKQTGQTYTAKIVIE